MERHRGRHHPANNRLPAADIRLPTGHLVAGIGPSISPQAFEVGDEVCQAFADAGFPMKRIAFRHPQSGKWHIDLWEANRLQLLQQGLSPSHIEVSGLCTYSQSERFFSARRLGIRSGRLLSGIMPLPNR